MPPSDGGCASRCRRPRKLRRLKRKYAWSYKKLASFQARPLVLKRSVLLASHFLRGGKGSREAIISHLPRASVPVLSNRGTVRRCPCWLVWLTSMRRIVARRRGS
jgi:hypothetical protein